VLAWYVRFSDLKQRFKVYLIWTRTVENVWVPSSPLPLRDNLLIRLHGTSRHAEWLVGKGARSSQITFLSNSKDIESQGSFQSVSYRIERSFLIHTEPYWCSERRAFVLQWYSSHILWAWVLGSD